KHLDCVDARQAEVEHDDVGVRARCSRQRLLSVRREVDVIASGTEIDTQRAPDLRLVVHDEHPCHAADSRLTITVSPPPGVSSTVGSPPMASMNTPATGKPSPVPLLLD